MDKRLYRSRDERMVSGVCAGIAEYFDLDPTVVRLATVALLFVTSGAVVLLYVIMAIVVPEAPAPGDPDSPRAMTGGEMTAGAQGFARDIQVAATRVAESLKGEPTAADASEAPAPADASAATPAPKPDPAASVAGAAAVRPGASTSTILIGLLLIAFGLLVFWQRGMGVDVWGLVSKLFVPGVVIVLGVLVLIRGLRKE